MKNMICDGKILNSVFNNLKIKESQKNSNIENAKKIYDKVPNSINKFPSNVGLVVGKVQSGKTANIIALSALAFDNDHSLIIMLLSDTNNLLDQNAGRIEKSFENIDNIEVLKKSKNGCFNTIDKDTLNYLYKKDKKIIICALKHYVHINQITDMIAGTEYANSYSMIIDDEGDDISHNTSSKKYAVDSQNIIFEKDRSSTNESIINLKKSLKVCGYISVTATPQANILLQTFQSLAPNYCVTIEPGDGYTGLITFHSLEAEHLIEVINDYDQTNQTNGIPESLEKAFIFFIVGAIIRNNRGEMDFKHSFMIHPSKKIIDHQKVFKKIEGYIQVLKYALKYNNQSCKCFVEKVKEEYEKSKKVTDTYLIDIEDVNNVINSLKLHCINGKNDMNDLDKRMKYQPYHIIVGGDMLDRGITISGLAVTYIIRESRIGQVDTLLQRARWFGYKYNYIDLCKVYLTEKLNDQFREIVDHEECVWEFLTNCSELSYDMKNADIQLTINSTCLNPTSSSKASYKVDSIDAWEIQKYFVRNKILNDNNIKLVEELASIHSEIITYNERQKHKKTHINFKEMKEFLNKFYFPEFSSIENNSPYDFEKIINLCNNNGINDSTLIDVMLMRYTTGEERATINNSNKIPVLLQGRSEGLTKEDQKYYKGDRYLVENNVMLQIHYVHLKNDVDEYYKKGDEVILIAIGFPNKTMINSIVKRKEINDLQRNFINLGNIEENG